MEAFGSIFLLVCVALALAWANISESSYESLWTTIASFDLGFAADSGDYRHWVNDGLMVIFFFVAGVEVKREISVGELGSIRSASLPVAGALGGMALPAIVFVAVNLGFGGSSTGWAVPIATDIAFAVGILALAPGVPREARIFLLSLAIADDIGSILIIAIFYSGPISVLPLGIGVLLLLSAAFLNRANFASEGRFLVLLPFLWLAVLESGLHPTIAGVALGLVTPARPRYDLIDSVETRQSLRQSLDEIEATHDAEERDVALGRLNELVTESEGLTDRIEHNLHFVSSFVVLPLFALANAGIVIRFDSLTDSINTPLFWGIAIGLVIGKSAGITVVTRLAVLLKIAALPQGFSWSQVLGTAFLGGIGFTVSLFIATLAFSDEESLQTAKLAVLFGSAVAGIGGYVLLKMTSSYSGPVVNHS